MTNNEHFLIDSNSFIEPFNRYYPFDITTKYWEQLKYHIESQSIFLLDIVRMEIIKQDDDLSNWIKQIPTEQDIDHREIDILNNYKKVLQYIQYQDCYKTLALENWAQANVADAWLIAAAITTNSTIITFEKPQIQPNSKNVYKNAKIPDVAKVFNVKVADLFYLMRTLNIKL